MKMLQASFFVVDGELRLAMEGTDVLGAGARFDDGEVVERINKRIISAPDDADAAWLFEHTTYCAGELTIAPPAELHDFVIDGPCDIGPGGENGPKDDAAK